MVTCEKTSCTEICGDGVRAGSEKCDDGNLNWYDGCSPSCTVECGYTCTGEEEGSSEDTCRPTCGDGVRSYYVEECDDGNSDDGDGCSSTCEVEEGWTCTGGWCDEGTCSPVCGDGREVGSEATDAGSCDDGNRNWYDGCSYHCTVECGWDCRGEGCTAICGDGMRRGREDCEEHRRW